MIWPILPARRNACRSAPDEEDAEERMIMEFNNSYTFDLW